jgi:hypothetical protein
MAIPMPREAPVTKATFVLFCPICLLLSGDMPGEESMQFDMAKIIHAILARLFVKME